ncbi:MAG: S-layer protein, partial [Methanoregula sp.]
MSETSGYIIPGNRDAARTGSHFSGRHISALRILCLVSIILAVLAVGPALAGTKYMAGSPELNAHIAGTNEFSPGDDVNLQVVIDNTGLNQFKIVKSSIIDATDLSNTAK